MAEVSLFFDERFVKKDGTCSVKVRVGEHRKYLYVPTGVSVSSTHWDGRNVVGCPGAAMMNAKINAAYVRVLTAVNRLEMDDSFSLRALKVALKVSGKDMTRFAGFYESVIGKKRGRTADIYANTLKKIRRYDSMADTLRFSDIDRDWLLRFDRWLEKQGNATNTRAIDMRNIRNVFNEAIDEELTKDYPFRRFTIKKERTRMRNLTVEQLRQLRDYPLDDVRAVYRDFFMLSFYLCGINAIDLLSLPSLTDGRAVYHRAKTGRLYDLPVCDEAKAIIERYKGKKYLLFPLERYKNYHDFLQRWNYALRRIGERKVVKDKVGKMRKYEYDALFPDLSTYWARYTFASVAAELDIPRDTIALCLGHSWADVTATYINYDVRKKVDKAVQQVVEYVRGENKGNNDTADKSDR